MKIVRGVLMCHSEPNALYGASTGKIEPIGIGTVHATRAGMDVRYRIVIYFRIWP